MAKATCGIAGCDRPMSCRGWCSLHYGRWRAHGDPLKVLAPKRARRLNPADFDAEGKTCSRCGRYMPLDAYRKRRATPDGLAYRCKDCIRDAYNEKFSSDPNFRERRARYFRSRPEAQRELARQRQRRNLRMYGLTVDDLERMMIAQGGVCAICARPPHEGQRDPRKKRLGVDHDHATRKVRGLLCDPCNIALGLFDDDPSRLAAAIQYLERFTG